MCGIIAALGVETEPIQRKNIIFRMLSSLQHRGPDGWGYYISREIALGQTRLSIVDLQCGNQPMFTENNIIVFNGEIFNYIEIRENLKKNGINFKTSSDTEVFLKSYEYYGEECFSKFNGQFAAIIWNKKSKELIIARDRFGVRPLYILEFGSFTYFSSEIKAFDQIPGYNRYFDIEKLFEHGIFWKTLGTKTIYQNISTLPAGYYARYRNGKTPVLKQYYELGNIFPDKILSLNEAVEQFVYLMDDAVKLRLRSDVEVGAYLSGGIDSSVILHLINNHSTKSFKSFSITFEDKEYDESSFQKEMTNYLNTEHHTINITTKKIDEAFPDVVYHTEHPIFRTAPVPLFLLSQKVKENNIKVVLTGEGADEILWGYDSFKEIKLLEFWSKFPASKIRPLLIRKLHPHLSHYNSQGQYGLMRTFYESFLSTFNNDLASLNIRIHNNLILEKYFNKDYNLSLDKDNLISGLKRWYPSNFKMFSPLQKNQYHEMNTLLSGYLLSSQGDRMSLAHGVEGRYPFLDYRVVDLLFHIDESYKLKGLNPKFLLKRSYHNNIPSSIINRPKQPYLAPDLKSFISHGKLTENASFFLSEDLINEYGIFNITWVQRFLSKFKDGVPNQTGYRDNMIISFIMSTQIANFWMRNPKSFSLPENKLTIAINEYN